MLEPDPQVSRSMAQRGLTQVELAEACGIRQATLSSIEQGVAWPRADNLALLCRALDVSADYLLGLSDDEKPNQTA